MDGLKIYEQRGCGLEEERQSLEDSWVFSLSEMSVPYPKIEKIGRTWRAIVGDV